MEKDLLKLFEEMHKLKLENEKLNIENSELKAALGKKAEDFFKAQDDCVFSYTSSNFLGNTVEYKIFNPTNVDADVRALLKGEGIQVIRSFGWGCRSDNPSVKVGGIRYYTNPYCDDARKNLESLQNEISSLQKEARELAAEVEWLRKSAEENGKPKSRGILGFRKPYM